MYLEHQVNITMENIVEVTMNNGTPNAGATFKIAEIIPCNAMKKLNVSQLASKYKMTGNATLANASMVGRATDSCASRTNLNMTL